MMDKNLIREIMYEVIEEMIPEKYRNSRYVIDWEIIELKDGTPVYKYPLESILAADMIKSIKRLSDGQIFTIEDEISLKWYDFIIPFYIRQFIVKNSRMFVRYDKTSTWEISNIRKTINCK